MPPRLLLLSFYFPPDLSAGSFRTASLVAALTDLAAAHKVESIEVLATAPNRYASFEAAAPAVEYHGAVTIHRFSIPRHASGLWDQSKSFLAYAKAVRKHVRQGSYDLVYATSSRLMTAALGAHVARTLSIPLYLDIRDIFVDTIGDVFKGSKARLAIPLFSRIERNTISQASKVNLVSEGFRDYFQCRYPSQSYSYFTNGIDPEFVAAASTNVTPASRDRARPLEVVYAGNIGEGQGLHAILPKLASRTAGRLRFTVIGDGGRRPLLEQSLRDAGVSNVAVTPPVPRARLIEAYRNADVLFLHLNDYDAFSRVLPSKIFEYAAIGQPIWAGVRGYAATFLKKEVRNAEVFPPCDAAGAIEALERLTTAPSPRPDFVAKFDRLAISRQIAEDILSVAARVRSQLSSLPG